jgi:uncharacterized protein YeaO (DUF488 family)
MNASIHSRHAYDASTAGDNSRLLVDRLWLRGLPRATAKIDLWIEAIVPRHSLRRWFLPRPARWDAIAQRCRAAFTASPTVNGCTRAAIPRWSHTTLLLAAHDSKQNNAVKVDDVLREQISHT